MNEVEKMGESLASMMPKEMAGAVNLFTPPLAGAAAMSALGIGFASHAFGVWMGAMAGAAEISQRLMQPMLDEMPGGARDFAPPAKAPVARARDAAEKLIRTTQDAAEGVARETRGAASSMPPVGEGRTGAAAALMPEDFRQPQGMEKPRKPDDLKAIAGVGPKLEQVLNGFGVWTYRQIAAWKAEEIAWMEDALGFKGRIGRDDWLGQAARLAGKKN
ncbi:NADH-ubiquinone dehydrogenase [Mesorhizobium sp. BE184]|nr:NADH-ubiquinone dehydrogenase [Mesorhizobium sp. BE184]MDR7035207.1 NADH-quinone oxidoreductase subunit E [Mesorhizobium sp. BE184]